MGADLNPGAAAALLDELLALLAERAPLVEALGRATACAERATADVAALRTAFDAAVRVARETADEVAAARRALARHDSAIVECRAEWQAAERSAPCKPSSR